ncbi:MAG: hypothetical protein BWY15_01571 [Firmicutes bacterium ADurb.Bin193]|nr:MAG: hypothetical protein BWY15_01571 [Firmicutes bacterium ADurb.Bin193]
MDTNKKKYNNSLSKSSFILSVLSVITILLPLLSVLLSAIAVVCGVTSLFQKENGHYAITGTIVGTIVLLIYLVQFIQIINLSPIGN